MEIVLATGLAVVGLRIVVVAVRVGRCALPWSRLLLPAILLVEGLGLWWQGGPAPWVRAATAIALEVTFVVLAIRALRRSSGTDLPEVRIAGALEALVPPRVARLVAVELVILGSAIRFAFGGWRRAAPPGFSYHRDSALRLFLAFAPLLAIGDVLLLELVILPHATLWVRLVVHGLALYGVIWMIGVYASLRARPHRLDGDRLVLHRGILGRLELPVARIVSVDPLPSFADDWRRRAYCKDTIRIDVAGPSVLELRLDAPARRVGVLGEGPPRDRVLVSTDTPADLIAAIAPDIS